MVFSTEPTDLTEMFWQKTVSDVVMDEKEMKKKRKAETASDEKTIITDDDESNKSDDHESNKSDDDESNKSDDDESNKSDDHERTVQDKHPPPSQHSDTTNHRVTTAATDATTDKQKSNSKPQGKKAAGTKMWNAKASPSFSFGARTTSSVSFASLAKMKPVPGAFMKSSTKEFIASAGSESSGFGASGTQGSGFGAAGFGASGSQWCGFGVEGFGVSGSQWPGFGVAGFGSSGFASSGFGVAATKGFGSEWDSTTASQGFASAGSSGFGSLGFGSPATTGFGSQASFGPTAFGSSNDFGFGPVPQAVMSNAAGPLQAKKKRKKTAPASKSSSVYAHGSDRVSMDTMSSADMRDELLHRHPTIKGSSKKAKQWFVEQLGDGSLREKLYSGPMHDLPRVDRDCSNRVLMEELRLRRPGFKSMQSGKDWLLRELVVGTVLLTSTLFEQRIMQGIITKKQQTSPTYAQTATAAQGGQFTGYSDDERLAAPVVPDGVQSNTPVFQPEAAHRNKRKRSTDNTGQATRRMKPKRQRQQVAPTPYGPQGGAPTEYNGVPVGEIRKDIYGEEYCYI